MLRRTLLVRNQFILRYLILCSSVILCFRLVLILCFFGDDNFRFIHERMLKGFG